MPVADELTLSELLELLSHRRRRFVLGTLDETDGDVPMDSLAKRLAAWEESDSPADATPPAVEDVKLSLYHTHLPKLETAGLVTFDSRHVRYDVGEPTPTDLSLDGLLQEERELMLANCC
ncbi:DUF7344 domain-containing protein [Haloarcula salinisoli]|uniref:DUF7344 domain-containing protein n=1 Tax=Haloarcula salinisoli TaxID=2487746 RepID=A0A8J7YGQ9_9EURY|nr:hypothetical protein [Halomicroarcula salinisoli]MBX0303001.1 hypothetical protein [Halomicroarcula salinisoli]